MRGKVSQRFFRKTLIRITPAYAGKRWGGGEERNQKKDHPRLCGEKSSAAFAFLFCAGSPPPMRGKAFFRKTFFTGRRITPAYAGKSGGANPRNHVSEDHPRLCGEKFLGSSQRSTSKGSPPPMRGKGLLTYCFSWS